MKRETGTAEITA